MPRTRLPLTKRNTKNLRSYQEAYEELQKGKTVREVAKMFDLNHVSLNRYKKKRQKALAGTPIDDVKMGYHSAAKVFSGDQEEELENYAMKSADIYFGFCATELKKMAYEMTLRYNLSRPASWDAKGFAGPDWCKSFLDRHPQLAELCARTSKLTRAKSFNKQRVGEFYDSLKKALDEHKFAGQDIYVLDEIGITPEQKSNRIIAQKGIRQVGSITSAECESIVTVTVAANAMGTLIEPMFTFTTGKKHGWMQEEDLLVFLQHFQSQAKCSLDHRVLLLLDNHASHLSIDCIDYCNANGIVVQSFPPYCSDKLQPLACSVYGTFKKAVNSACDEWIKSNPEVKMTIYDIPKIVTDALPQAFPQTNVLAGFSCTGIYPFTRDVLSDLDIAPWTVTETVQVLVTD